MSRSNPALLATHAPPVDLDLAHVAIPILVSSFLVCSVYLVKRQSHAVWLLHHHSVVFLTDAHLLLLDGDLARAFSSCARLSRLTAVGQLWRPFERLCTPLTLISRVQLPHSGALSRLDFFLVNRSFAGKE